MTRQKFSKYRHFEPEIILLCLRWYLRYSLSCRDLEEMMAERGLSIDPTTIYRWVQHYAPLLARKCRTKLKPTNDSWRVDETYIKVKGGVDVFVQGGGLRWQHSRVHAQPYA